MAKKTPHSPLVYIVMRNRDAFPLTKTALASLSKLTYPNYRILIIDDGSRDDSADRLKKIFPNIELIKTQKYLEYCKSFNLGIKHALKHKAKFIFLVNNDTKDFSRNYLERIVETFQRDKKIGLVGSKCFDYKDGVRWEGKAKIKFGVPMDTPTEGFIVKSETFKKVGLLNENLVRYFEDLDFIVRLRKKGYKTKPVTSVSFAHLGGGTSSKQIFIPNYYRVRNIFLFIKRHCADKPIAWKINTFKTNMIVHINRLKEAFENKEFLKFIKLLISILLGLIAGVFSPWRENDE